MTTDNQPFTAVGVGWIDGEQRVALAISGGTTAYLPLWAARHLAAQITMTITEIKLQESEDIDNMTAAQAAQAAERERIKQIVRDVTEGRSNCNLLLERIDR